MNPDMTQALLLALAGGVLIGLASVALLYSHGRIAGISGILGGMLDANYKEFGWRLAFVVGMIAGGVILLLTAPEAIGTPTGRSLPAMVVAGLLVGFGTRLGSGCTSGHGICGLSRFSGRSLVAVLTFMLTGAVTVFVVRVFLGGAA